MLPLSASGDNVAVELSWCGSLASFDRLRRINDWRSQCDFIESIQNKSIQNRHKVTDEDQEPVCFYFVGNLDVCV